MGEEAQGGVGMNKFVGTPMTDMEVWQHYSDADTRLQECYKEIDFWNTEMKRRGMFTNKPMCEWDRIGVGEPVGGEQ